MDADSARNCASITTRSILRQAGILRRCASVPAALRRTTRYLVAPGRGRSTKASRWLCVNCGPNCGRAFASIRRRRYRGLRLVRNQSNGQWFAQGKNQDLTPFPIADVIALSVELPFFAVEIVVVGDCNSVAVGLRRKGFTMEEIPPQKPQPRAP